MEKKKHVRKYIPAHIRGKALVDKIEKSFGQNWFRYKDAEFLFDKTDHNCFFILVTAGVFKHIGSQYCILSPKMSAEYILAKLQKVKDAEIKRDTIKAAIFLLENEGYKINKP